MKCMESLFANRNKRNREEMVNSVQNNENGLLSGNEEGNSEFSPNNSDFTNTQFPQNNISEIITYISTIEDKVSDVINRLNRIDLDRLILIQDGMKEMKASLDDTSRSIIAIDNRLDNIKNACESKDDKYRNIFNEESFRSLQNQISDYKEDLYLKLLSKYVIDINIVLFKHIAYRNYELTNMGQKDIELEKLQKIILQRFMTIGILNVSTKEGKDFDPEFMTASDYSIGTTDINLSGKIALSLIPRFIWSLPSLQQQNTSLMLSKEEVILYDNLNI